MKKSAAMDRKRAASWRLRCAGFLSFGGFRSISTGGPGTVSLLMSSQSSHVPCGTRPTNTSGALAPPYIASLQEEANNELQHSKRYAITRVTDGHIFPPRFVSPEVAEAVLVEIIDNACVDPNETLEQVVDSALTGFEEE